MRECLTLMIAPQLLNMYFLDQTLVSILHIGFFPKQILIVLFFQFPSIRLSFERDSPYHYTGLAYFHADVIEMYVAIIQIE